MHLGDPSVVRCSMLGRSTTSTWSRMTASSKRANAAGDRVPSSTKMAARSRAEVVAKADRRSLVRLISDLQTSRCART